MKKLALLTAALVITAVFVCAQLDAYTDLYNIKSLKFTENTSIPSIYKHSIYSLHKKHTHKNNERVKQGIVFVSEEYKKIIQAGSTCTGTANLPIVSGFYSGNSYSSTEVMGLGSTPILKTRK
jgi:hypothetical protein